MILVPHAVLPASSAASCFCSKFICCGVNDGSIVFCPFAASAPFVDASCNWICSALAPSTALAELSCCCCGCCCCGCVAALVFLPFSKLLTDGALKALFICVNAWLCAAAFPV